MAELEQAKKLARELKARKAREAGEGAKILEEERIRKQFASEFWTDVRVAFKNEAQVFNDEVGEEILTWEAPTPNAFSLRRKDMPRRMTASHNEARYKIELRLFGRSAPLEVALDHGSGKARLFDPTGMPRCPDCGSNDVRPSKRRGLLDAVILPLLFLAPLRCHGCHTRFYGFVFSKRGSKLYDPKQLAGEMIGKLLKEH